MSAGCPRHANKADKKCGDYRCIRTWVPEGAVTPEEQLTKWVAGESICPNTLHECCPDFSCCTPKLKWPEEKRKKFAAAKQGEREKMMMGGLDAFLTSEVPSTKTHITRGDPTDNQ